MNNFKFCQIFLSRVVKLVTCKTAYKNCQFKLVKQFHFVIIDYTNILTLIQNVN